MQQWDAEPAPRALRPLRPATTPRWSGTSGHDAPRAGSYSAISLFIIHRFWENARISFEVRPPAKPLRPRKLGQLPTAWGALLRGLRPRESLSTQWGGGRASARPEGLWAAFPLLPACAVVGQHTGAGVADIAVRPCAVGHPVINDHAGLTGVVFLKKLTVEQAFLGKGAAVAVAAAALGKLAVRAYSFRSSTIE